LILARVVGNIVSTVKDSGHQGHKLMLVQCVDDKGIPDGPRMVAFDCAHAGVGDLVLVNIDGGAAKSLLDDQEIIADITICGVIDHYDFDGQRYSG
jgi:microcompartment protein CcmK/EutM